MPQDWFAKYAAPESKAPAAPADDWFARYEATPRRTHRTEDYLDPVESRGSALGRFVSNAGEMLNPITMATGLYQAVRHPIDTGAALLESQRAQFRRGTEDLGEGRYAEAAGRFGASMLPVLGPIAAEAGEQIAAGDVAGGFGKAAGMLAPFGAAPAVRAVAKALPAKAAPALEKLAADRVADVMSPRSTAQKALRLGNKAEKIAPTLAKDPEITGNWSQSALHETVKAKHLEAQANLDAVADARLSARTFDTKPIVDDLIEKRKQFVAQPVEASKLTPKIVESPDLKPALKAQSELRQKDRAFVMQWLADDLTEMSYQPGGSTTTARNEAFRNWRPGDPESAKYGIGQGSARVAGTPTQEMFHAIGMTGSRASIAERVSEYVAGKKPNPKLDALGDALMEAWDGTQFNFEYVTDETLKSLGSGVKRGDLRNPMIGPTVANHPPEMMARWLPKWAEEGIEPAYDVSIPKSQKVGVPIGRSVVPGPAGDRVGMIDQAIREIKQLGPVARYEDIRKIRMAYDGPAAVVYNPAMTPDFLKAQGTAKGAADVTGTLRGHMAKWDPDTAAANADYSLYKSAKDIMDAAAEIERVRPKVGRKIGARATASIVGGQQAGWVGAIGGYVAGPVIDSVVNAGYTTKLQSARIMQQMAAAIRKGDTGRVESLRFQLKKLAKQAAPATTRSAASQQPVPEGYR